MWYLKRLDVYGKLEQLVTCEINPPKFNNAYKIISKEEYDSLSNNGSVKEFNASLAEEYRIAVEKEAAIQGVDLSLSGSGGSGGVISMFNDFYDNYRCFYR